MICGAYIVRSSTGLRSSKTIVPLVVNYLNNSFANARIQFVLQGVDLLDNNYEYLAGKERELLILQGVKMLLIYMYIPQELMDEVGTG